MFELEYDDPQYEVDAPREFVERALEALEKRLDVKGFFSLTFVSDEEIHELNRDYRNIDSPTDILTFAMNDGEAFPMPEDMDEEDKVLGDVFISIDAMRRNAEYFEVDENEELSRLLCHGVLHLLGYDHETNDFKTEPMLALQEQILVELNFFK